MTKDRFFKLAKNFFAVFGLLVAVLGSGTFIFCYWGMVELDHGVSGRPYGEIILGEDVWNFITGRNENGLHK